MTAAALTPGSLALFAGATVLRATVLLAGATLLALALRRGPATLRHGVWSVTLVALLTLPVLTWALPAVSVPLPLPDAAVFTSQQEEGTPPPLPAFGLVVQEPGAFDGVARPAPAASEAPAAVSARGGFLQKASWIPAGLLLLWGAGALALGLPLARGWRRATRLCRGALPLGAAGWDEAAWIGALRRAARRVGVRRRVALRTAAEVRTALAGGVRRPVILLPPGAEGWSEERRGVVLTHELVHLRRWDALRQVAGRLVLALYWFHPLAWWAVGAAARAREEACDEAVLALGHPPASYASHLLELASAPVEAGRGLLGLGTPHPTLARLDSPRLETRIMNILRHRNAGAGGGAGAPGGCRRSTLVALSLVAAVWAIAAALVVPADRAHAADGDAVVAQGAAFSLDGVVVPPAPPSPGVAAPPGFPGSPALPAPPAPPPPAEDEADFCEPERVGIAEVGGAPRVAARIIVRQDGGGLVCVQSQGRVSFTDDRTDIASLEPGGWLVVASQDQAGERRVEIEPGPDGLVRFWMVDGEVRPFDAEARSWFASSLGVLGDELDRLDGPEGARRDAIVVERDGSRVEVLRGGRAILHPDSVGAARGVRAVHVDSVPFRARVFHPDSGAAWGVRTFHADSLGAARGVRTFHPDSLPPNVRIFHPDSVSGNVLRSLHPDSVAGDRRIMITFDSLGAMSDVRILRPDTILGGVRIILPDSLGAAHGVRIPPPDTTLQVTSIVTTGTVARARESREILPGTDARGATIIVRDPAGVARGVITPQWDRQELARLFGERMRAGGPLAGNPDLELARQLARHHEGISDEDRRAIRASELTVEEMVELFAQIDRMREERIREQERFRELIREMVRLQEGPARGRR